MKSLLVTLLGLGTLATAADSARQEVDAFAVHMFAALADTQQRNVVFSPSSIESVLRLLQQGARGRTAEEIAALPLGGANVKSTIATQEANAVFLAEDTKLKPSIKVEEIRRVPFSSAPGKAISVINEWARVKTHGRIPTILTADDVSADTRMVASSAIYLKAQWSKTFDPDYTRNNAPFHMADGNTAQVDLMWQRGELRYAEGENWQAVALFYEEEPGSATGSVPTCFIGILPRQSDAREFARTLTPETYQTIRQALAGGYPQDTIVYLPKFEITTATFTLVPGLKKCGVTTAFSSQADFSGWTDRPLMLSDVLQRCFIRLDEDGTEAAAVTLAVEEDGCCADEEPSKPNRICFNRPFIWLIGDLQSDGVPYFMGLYEQP